ncbi:MAG: NAD(P)-dependent oxidoreductase [Desulfobacteraceae bacterium]|nr:NAD(P)-dependent oxidoreductase [Desulfobacteraceae bacterium]
MTTKSRIGFIGLGMMGLPMARNLLSAGYALTVYNRSPEKAAALTAAGAQWVENPWQTAEPGGIVISCVADDTALEGVVLSDRNLAQQLGTNGIHISMSTILPATAEQLARDQQRFGGDYVAAPVMGRPDVVQARKQSYFIAGSEGAKARIRPILDELGARVFDFGANPAAANTAKLAANFLIAAAIEAMAEAFVFAAKNGADPGALLSALGSTLFACPIYQNYGRAILEKSYTQPLFKMPLGLKDMRLVARTASESHTPMRIARLLEDRFLAAMAHGKAGLDWTGIAAEVAEEAGLTGAAIASK